MIDSHCHLADEAFASDLETVVDRARAAGVSSGLCVMEAADTAEAERARHLCTIWPALRFAIGVHPHQAGKFTGRTGTAVGVVREAIDANPAARAVGEIGLDYHYEFSPRETQREVFRCQIRLARELGWPVVIHTREAETDTFEILRAEGDGQLAGIFHCFTGDVAMARRALDLGFHVSFAGIVTFPRATALREAAKVVPANRLLVETDAPYLAPVPHRGKRNEPAWVTHVVDTLAEVRSQAAESVAAAASCAFSTLIRP